MSKQDNKHPSLPKRPTTNKRDDWRNFWKEVGQPWRTEPEIDAARQAEFTDRFLAMQDINSGDEEYFYVFDKDMELSRADIEWLLATHKQKQKAIDESDKSQQHYKGLDLRGVDLHGKNLRGLPMKSINLHKANLEAADLSDADLEDANLSGANLKRAKLYRAHLEKADLDGASLEQAQLTGAYLEGVHGGLNPTNIKSALLNTAHLEGSSFLWVDMERSVLEKAHLEGAHLIGANLEGANLAEAHLEGVNLGDAHLEGASLKKAYLHGANLSNAHLERANLSEAHLEGKNMPDDIRQAVQQWEKDFPKELLPANLSGTFFDNTTNLTGITLSNEHEIEKVKRKVGPQVADIHWGDVNLAVVDWSGMDKLGDEYQARHKEREAEELDQNAQFPMYQTWYQTAMRANRQLAVALQEQGINDHAARFAYRAQTIQRHILLLQLLHYLRVHPKLRWLVSKHAKPSDYRQILRSLLVSLITAFIFAAIAILGVNMPIPLRIIFSSATILLFSASFCGIVLALLYYQLITRVVVLILLPISIFYINLAFCLFVFLAIILIYPGILFVLFMAFIFIIVRILSAESGFWKWENIKKRTHRLYSFLFPEIQAAYGRYIFSLFLDMLAGYGYKPVRSIAAYLLIIITFASLYYYIGQGIHPPITPVGAFVLSITSFHGRGFFPGIDPSGKPLPLDNPLIVLAAAEAAVGLIIEISFIATFTQRFFAK